MAQITATIRPEEVGMSSERLARIDDHFRAYVDDGRLPGYSVAVARYGQLAHVSHYGMRNVEDSLPVAADTMYRIYSMTKPITSVACMMLVEEGKLQLTDEVREFIPSFGDTRVFRGGSSLAPLTEPQREPMRVWHLLTHTAGLTYGFNYYDAIDDMYRRAGFDYGIPQADSLEQICDRYAALPLVFHPGSSWNYSVATDVLGRVVEVVSGMSLDRFFEERIFAPLKMHDTAFWAPESKHDRMAALYIADTTTRKARRGATTEQIALRKPTYFSGGGGLVSTPYDYWRFLQMCENGGELEGARIISPTTLDLMTMNHLPNNADISSWGRPLGDEIFYNGLGFGLGFAVVIDQAKTKVACPNGTYSWGGMASTAFWVDPVEEVTAMFFTQLVPSTTHPIRPYLRSLVYQAIIE